MFTECCRQDRTSQCRGCPNVNHQKYPIRHACEDDLTLCVEDQTRWSRKDDQNAKYVFLLNFFCLVHPISQRSLWTKKIYGFDWTFKYFDNCKDYHNEDHEEQTDTDMFFWTQTRSQYRRRQKLTNRTTNKTHRIIRRIRHYYIHAIHKQNSCMDVHSSNSSSFVDHMIVRKERALNIKNKSKQLFPDHRHNKEIIS